MDIDFIKQNIPLFAEAARLTVQIAILGIVFAAAAGLICAVVRYFRIPLLRQAAACYIEISRNTPLLIQLFFLYFGLPKAGIVLSSEACAIIGLAFQGGSYMAEVFRSGLENVPAIQQQAGLALGMKRGQVFRYIVLPQAVSNSVPAFCANIIFLIKETSVFSAVALADLMYVTKDLIGMYYKTDESLLMLVAAYLIILLPISVVSTVIERRVRYGEFGH